MPKTPMLSKAALAAIDAKIDEIFERMKYRSFGPRSGRRLFFRFDPKLSVPGIYEQAVTEEGGKPDFDLLERIMDVTSDYLDRYKSEAKAQVKKKVQDLLRDAASGQIPPSAFSETLASEFDSLWGSVTESVKRLMYTESQHAQTLGVKEGIDQVNANLGVSDPVVFFVTARDTKVCDECRSIHMLPDGVTPRVWLSSEVESGYHKKGTDNPSWTGMHPHCRCGPSTLLPGYGFDKGGRVTYKGLDWNELQHQREGS